MKQSNLIPFKFQNTEIRVVKKDGDFLFVAQDICKGLDIANYRDAVVSLNKNLIDAGIKGVVSTDTLLETAGGKQNMLCVTETGLNLLVMQSRKASAMKFKFWLASEVLPSIRKTGSYTTEAIKQLQLELQQTSQDLNLIMHSGNTYTTTEIAKELGLKSANALNKLLSQAGVIYKANKTWVLKSRYADKGFTETKSRILHDKSVKYTTQWSEFGRVFLNNFSSQRLAA